MRITVFAPDIPYPPNRGGRADVWRRILALRALGHEVMLVCLHEATGPLAPTAADLAAVDAVVERRFMFPMRRSPWRTLRQLALAWHTPWHAATRVPTAAERQQLWALLDDFAPHLLWLDGPWFGRLVLMRLAARAVPFAYRSHNVEHMYLWKQAAVAVRLRDRLAWRLACIGVQRLERRLMSDAAAVFDISMDDMAFWGSRGIRRQHWLPPLPELATTSVAPLPVAGDVVFLGNLGTPNNVRGVEFLAREVWPLVHQRMPGIRLAVVGSNPTLHVRSCVADCPSAELRENVLVPMSHILGARVLVNPVMTGSGVQLKMLDMLMTDVPIVSASQGLRGLPVETSESVFVCDDAEKFAEAICNAFAHGMSLAASAARQRTRARYTVAGLGEALISAGLLGELHD